VENPEEENRDEDFAPYDSSWCGSTAPSIRKSEQVPPEEAMPQRDWIGGEGEAAARVAVLRPRGWTLEGLVVWALAVFSLDDFFFAGDFEMIFIILL
jgi:hypothetical protein